jgi:hypothetical protein
VEPESSSVTVTQRLSVPSHVPTAQSALFVHVGPAPAAIVSVAADGHSVDPPSVVVVVAPMLVVVVPPIEVVVVPPMLVVVVPPIVVVGPPMLVVVVPPIEVVVVPPMLVVVVPGTVVVDDVVEVVKVVEVVVEVGQGQLSVTPCPTAFFKQMSASLAVVPPAPLVSQTHSGVQVSEPTAVRRMNKQSEAVGLAPFVTGWPQSPLAAKAAGGPARAMMASRATPKEVKRRWMRMLKKGLPFFVARSD